MTMSRIGGMRPWPISRGASIVCSWPARDSRSSSTWLKSTARVVKYTAAPVTTRMTPRARVNHRVRRQRAVPNTSSPQGVSGAPHRADQVAVIAPVDLAAEVGDIHVDQVGVRRVVIAPDVVQYLGPGDDAALVAPEELQQGELLGAEVDRLTGAFGAPASQVQRQVRGLELVGLAGLDAAAAQGAQAGQ